MNELRHYNRRMAAVAGAAEGSGCQSCMFCMLRRKNMLPLILTEMAGALRIFVSWAFVCFL